MNGYISGAEARKIVLRAMSDGKSYTITEIADKTGLGYGRVSNMIGFMYDLVASEGKKVMTSKNGRNARMSIYKITETGLKSVSQESSPVVA
jgi:hypothetical protein